MNVECDGLMTTVFDTFVMFVYFKTLDTNSHNIVLHGSKKACQPSTHLKDLLCYFVVDTLYELCSLLKAFANPSYLIKTQMLTYLVKNL